MLAKLKTLLMVIVVLFPWFIRRVIYKYIFKYKIGNGASIGFSFVDTAYLELKAGAKIGSFNVIKGLTKVELGSNSIIGSFNWISAYPKNGKLFYTNQSERVCELLLGEHSAITSRHLIDCTDSVKIGRFSTIAGYNSQIFTHSIDIDCGTQIASSVEIGDYTFIGSGVIVIGGSVVPSYSVFAARSLINKKYELEYSLYAGVPAIFIKEINPSARYFSRKVGVVS